LREGAASPASPSFIVTFNFILFMEAFWAVFAFRGSGPALTAHGLSDVKEEIQIQMLPKYIYFSVKIKFFDVKWPTETADPCESFSSCIVMVGGLGTVKCASPLLEIAAKYQIESINQSVNQSINQSFSQSIDYPINETNNNQSTN
jgi:hypothetical protein